MSKASDDRAEMKRLLRRAAELATAHSITSEAFVIEAWRAYLACHPGLREEMEDKALRTKLQKERERGKIAQA